MVLLERGAQAFSTEKMAGLAGTPTGNQVQKKSRRLHGTRSLRVASKRWRGRRRLRRPRKITLWRRDQTQYMYVSPSLLNKGKRWRAVNEDDNEFRCQNRKNRTSV
jgi:hypothetical protein